MEKQRILLVEDEHGVATIFRLLLERTGRFIVRTEDYGARALESARQFRPELIFLDLCLPDKDGVAVAIELQNDPALKDVPIVFLTGLGKDGADGSFRAFPVLAKPIRGNELVECANTILGCSETVAASDLVSNLRGGISFQ
jgi:two-component system, OmpR family, response regulator